ncbi:NUDIX domain-containing protein [Effusibacillus lacus]|uniref:ADP-ribose pyrophosphatase n=1 Tax=Effusibacillus lacus TaxID=1348429 RepID=A0A292YTR3_9BACL|nr:NUDIX hydrolase [Effusibacillus lacus]TCS76331.1 ADP-ribose pyrophosphatase [Effusibacillus lacus]GAX91875.1 ADP-ribose pyrophosphatase [Effusibacillus lacus]
MNHKHLAEPTVSTEKIFEGKIISLYVDTVTLPNGKQATREIVHHPGAVAVLALTEKDRVILVRQFRKPCDRTLVEIPAGKLEPGEDPAECAKRELLEETGYTAKEWRHLHSMYTSPGFADEKIHLYLAKGLTKGQQELDADEFLDLMEADMAEAERLLASGEIADAKTMVALYWWMKERAKAEK